MQLCRCVVALGGLWPAAEVVTAEKLEESRMFQQAGTLGTKERENMRAATLNQKTMKS